MKTTTNKHRNGLILCAAVGIFSVMLTYSCSRNDEDLLPTSQKQRHQVATKTTSGDMMALLKSNYDPYRFENMYSIFFEPIQQTSRHDSFTNWNVRKGVAK